MSAPQGEHPLFGAVRRRIFSKLGCLWLLCCALALAVPSVPFLLPREPVPGPDTPVFDVALENGVVTPSENIVVDEGDNVILRISADRDAEFGPVGGPVYSADLGHKIQFEADRTRRFEFLDAQTGERIGEEVVIGPSGEG